MTASNHHTYAYLLAEFGIDITGGGKLEPRVGVGAGGALRAEAGEVVDAEDAADVPVDRESSLVSQYVLLFGYRCDWLVTADQILIISTNLCIKFISCYLLCWDWESSSRKLRPKAAIEWGSLNGWNVQRANLAPNPRRATGPTSVPSTAKSETSNAISAVTRRITAKS